MATLSSRPYLPSPGYFALWLAATMVVAASLNKSIVASDHVMDICSRFRGFLELSISKDDDLTYDYKCRRYFLKAILTSKSL
jgi:hypothetical protein